MGDCTEPSLPSPPLDPQDRPVDECRLWIGNLHPKLTEFSLMKLLQQFGILKKFDLLYHKTGVDQGKPRGYCFATYDSKEIADKAQQNLDGQRLFSRRIVVRRARADKKYEQQKTKDVPNMGVKSSGDTLSNDAKIRAIEAKLKLMEGHDVNEVKVASLICRRTPYDRAHRRHKT